MMAALSVSPTMPETTLATSRITTRGFASRPRPVRSRRKWPPVSTEIGAELDQSACGLGDRESLSPATGGGTSGAKGRVSDLMLPDGGVVGCCLTVIADLLSRALLQSFGIGFPASRISPDKGRSRAQWRSALPCGTCEACVYAALISGPQVAFACEHHVELSCLVVAVIARRIAIVERQGSATSSREAALTWLTHRSWSFLFRAA